MKTTTLISLSLALVSTCAAQQVLRKFDWQNLANAGQSLGGVPVTVAGKAALKIANTNDTLLQVRLFEVQNPPITKILYSITGEVKYEAVRGNGYLEMWNYYPPLTPGMPEGAFFSRTLGESGEMGKLSGTSDWRRFMLPFDGTGSRERPSRLEINLFLPAQGTVYLSALQLVEYNGSFVSAGRSSSTAWWSDRTAGLIGGIGGSVLGCFGSLLSWLASKGKSRGFVLFTVKGFICLGAALAVVGFIALGTGQPFWVWFTLSLPALILTATCIPGFRQYQRRYEELELRKMTALDAMG